MSMGSIMKQGTKTLSNFMEITGGRIVWNVENRSRVKKYL